MMRVRAIAALLVFVAAPLWAQTYDTQGRLKTTAEVTNTSATASPVASRLTDGSAFIVPVLDTTLTTRFPGGSTPADNESNAVTITRSGAFMFVFDGATWDRWTGAVSGTVTVEQSNEALLRAIVHQGGSWSVTPSLTDNSFTSNVLPIAALYDTTPAAITDGNAGIPRMTSSRILMNATQTITPLTASGTITADSQSVAIDVQGYSAVGIQISGTWTGTMDFQGTVDGTNWQNILFSSPSAVSSGVFGATANGIWVANIGGLDQIRVFGNDWVSGTVVVNLQASTGTTQYLKPTLLAAGQVLTDLTTINNGTAIAVNNGAASSGTQRVTIASDSTGTLAVTQAVAANLNATVTDGAGALNVIVDSSALPTGASTLAEQQTQTTSLQLIDNLPVAQGSTTLGQSGVLAQGAVTTAAPTYTTDQTSPISLQTDGSQRVAVTNTPTVTANAGTNLNTSALLTTSAHDAAFGTAGSADAQVRTVQGIVGGTAVPVSGTVTANAGTGFPFVDPCQAEARSVYRVDIVTATTTEIAAAVASEYYWICSVNLMTAGANNVIIVEDDTATNCPSPTAGVSSGGTTAAEGYNFAANGGIVVGTGSNWVMKTTTANRSICIITSAAVQLSGTITYVSAP